MTPLTIAEGGHARHSFSPTLRLASALPAPEGPFRLTRRAGLFRS